MNSTAVPFYTLTLTQQLRQLLLTHSAQEIHTTLLGIFREDYDFYKTLFQTPPTPQTPSQTSQTLPPSQTPQPTPQQKIRGDVKVNVKKMPSEDTIESLKVDSLPDSPEPVALHPVSQKKSKEQLKIEQQEKVTAKKAELEALGVVPQTLLTESNLRQWVEVKGLTYAQVARDYVGLPEKQIAEAARTFGITSSISKKRAAIIASKRG